MDNFEFDSRYARIEQENPDLKYPYAAKRRGVWCSTHNAITVDGEIARDAVCWRLLKELRKVNPRAASRVVLVENMDDELMTEWEAILGIKEKA